MSNRLCWVKAVAGTPPVASTVAAAAAKATLRYQGRSDDGKDCRRTRQNPCTGDSLVHGHPHFPAAFRTLSGTGMIT